MKIIIHVYSLKICSSCINVFGLSEKTELNLKLASLITHDFLPPTHMTNKNNPSFWIFKSYSRISGNFLKVVIYYEDLNYEEIKEEPMYDVSTFKY